MGKMLSDAQRKLVWVPTIADKSGPTTAELTAGSVLDISCLVTAADFSLGATGENAIDDPALCARANDQAPGRVTYEAGMNFFRWDTAEEDVAFQTFTSKGLDGFLVQRIGKDYDIAFASGDTVQVYECITGTPMNLAPAGGGFEKFRQMFYIQSAGTDERATVA